LWPRLPYLLANDEINKIIQQYICKNKQKITSFLKLKNRQLVKAIDVPNKYQIS